MSRLYSIIICTCNRPDLLKEALGSIARLKTTPDLSYEVLVIDNSPDGALRPAVESIRDAFKGKLSYHAETRRGKSFALNYGITKAKGDILAFTDDDINADENWLVTLNAKFNQYGCDGIGGRVLPVYPQGTPQWVKDNAVQIAGGVVIYDYGTQDFPLTDAHYAFIGANYAFKREIFKEYGHFRTDLGPGTPAMGEDTEFTERLLKLGKKLYYCGEVLIWHPFDPKRVTLSHMARWHMALGHYAAIKEMENNVKISSYFLSIPRYLWKGIVVDFGVMIVSVLNRMAFLNAWRSFFRKCGMIEQYRKKRS